MAKVKKAPKHPAVVPVKTHGGCKVGWEWYEKKSDAKKVSAWAKKMASYKAAQGYDFGYQSPGVIQKDPDGYAVCVP